MGRADHDEGQQRLAQRWIRDRLGQLERGQDLTAQPAGVFKGFHTGREGRPVVVAEVGVGGAARHDQGVVAPVQPATVRRHPVDEMLVQVEVRDIGLDGPGVALTLDHLAQRWRDQALAQQPGGDLVQQRLEEMMIGPVRNGHVGIGLSQRLGHAHPAEPAAHHENLVPSACLAGQGRATGVISDRRRLAMT